MNAESTREALDVASLAGDILLASGAEIFRCLLYTSDAADEL